MELIEGKLLLGRIMAYHGHVKNGMIVIDGLRVLPDVTEVRIEQVAANNGTTLGQRLLKHAGAIVGLPRDLARNHDHYLHEMTKK